MSVEEGSFQWGDSGTWLSKEEHIPELSSAWASNAGFQAHPWEPAALTWAQLLTENGSAATHICPAPLVCSNLVIYVS